MADVVGAELDLEAVVRGRRRVAHCAGVEDEDVQAVAVRCELLACGLDRVE